MGENAINNLCTSICRIKVFLFKFFFTQQTPLAFLYVFEKIHWIL